MDVEAACDALLERAAKRLATARAAMAGEDWEGAFANAYDVYRMAAEVLLLRQGLRATGGDGSHVAVEDAVSGQFGGGGRRVLEGAVRADASRAACVAVFRSDPSGEDG